MAKDKIGEDELASSTNQEGEKKDVKPEVGDTLDRIKLLKDALKDVDNQISEARIKSLANVFLLGILCTILICLGIYFGTVLADSEPEKDYSLPQVLYIIFARLVLVSASFFIANYVFRLLKSFVHIHQRNNHRMMVIKSMANLVESNSAYLDRQKIYNKLLDIIVNFDKTGIISDKEEELKFDFKQVSDLIKLIKTGD